MNQDIGKRLVMKLLAQFAMAENTEQRRAERMKTGGSTSTATFHEMRRPLQTGAINPQSNPPRNAGRTGVPLGDLLSILS